MGSIFSKHKFKGSSSDNYDTKKAKKQCVELSRPRSLQTDSSSTKSADEYPSKTPKTSSSSSNPPKERAQRTESYEHLQLGSLTETWGNHRQWNRFKRYLSTHSEGEDSDGFPMSLDRYAIFLELYSDLDAAERHRRVSPDELRRIIENIRIHPEDFFGRERCLKCIDGGIRSKILSDVKRVLRKEIEPGLWVFQPAYYRVLDKLNDLVGTFNDPESLS